MESLFGESGFLPPPVFFFSLLILLCSFLALLTIPRHFSFTSITDLLQIPREFTRSVICSQILILFLFVRVLENLLFMMSMFSSADPDSKITVAFRGCEVWFSRPLSWSWFLVFRHVWWQKLFCDARAPIFTMATNRIAAYPVDSYPWHYPGFVQRLFIHWITIRWIAILSTG